MEVTVPKINQFPQQSLKISVVSSPLLLSLVEIINPAQNPMELNGIQTNNA
jgi:hypothetical protein